MKTFKHNPHPVDLSDFFYGRTVVLGGRDFDREEHSGDDAFTEKSNTSRTILSTVNKLRRSVSEKLFTFELKEIRF